MYGTKEEYMFRLKIFSESLQKVNDHNEQYPEDAVWGINHMSDWTQKEYQRLLGWKEHPRATRAESTTEVSASMDTTEEEEDTWRKTLVSTGEPRVPSPQSRTRVLAAHAGLSLPLVPWRVLTS
jgi:hypothetical protein